MVCEQRDDRYDSSSILAGKRSLQLSALNRYLQDHGISQRLSMMVERNALHALAEQKMRVPEDSIELLQLVSENLRSELHFEVFSPVLLAHPFFGWYSHWSPMGIRRICHDAVTQISFLRGDLIFSKNEIPEDPSMFFIVCGTLAYNRHDTQRVGPEHWIAEAALWTQWMYRGSLRVARDSQVLVLDSQKFQGIAKNYPGPHVRMYAQKFVAQLCESDVSALTDVGTNDHQADRLVSHAFPREDSEPPERRSSKRSSALGMLKPGLFNRRSSAGSVEAEPQKQVCASSIGSARHGVHRPVSHPRAHLRAPACRTPVLAREGRRHSFLHKRLFVQVRRRL